jgi:1-acyl-sn-glycerol-3-phosphate acyltransferase
LIYWLLKLPAAISFWMYCRILRVNDKDYFKTKGPLLIACNHPNSFLDAIILSSLFRRPVYSLARGDVFNNKFIAILLRSMKILPVYRTSEGVENLEHNYTTFKACKEIFKKNGIVLIFSEGRCINEWHLRPLMKGTARLAISSWEDGIELSVLPTGINYQQFALYGKNIHLNFAPVITKNDVTLEYGFGKSVISFNSILRSRLIPLVYEIDRNDLGKIKHHFIVAVPLYKKILLAIPSFIGRMVHAPLYYPVKKLAKKYGWRNDHYDSILIGTLLLCYPIYLMMGWLILSFFIDAGYNWLVFVLIPFCGWSFTQLKKQL